MHEYDRWKLLSQLIKFGADPDMVAKWAIERDQQWELHTQKFPHKEFLNKVKNSLPMADSGVRSDHFVKLVTKKMIITGAPDPGYYLYKFYDRMGNLGVFFKQTDFSVGPPLPPPPDATDGARIDNE